MRYLKIFESFEEDDTYEFIHPGEWGRMVHLSIGIDNNEFEKIKSITSEYDEIQKTNLMGEYSEDRYNYICCRLVVEKHGVIEINQLPDEYYLVFYETLDIRLHYKCDQLSGLSDCIKMIMSK